MRQFVRLGMIVLLVVANLALAAYEKPAAGQETFSQQIAQRLGGDSPWIVEGRALNLPLLRRFYARRGFAPAWLETEGTRLRPQASVVAAVLAAAGNEGLEPDDYGAVALQARLQAFSPEPEERLALEGLLSESLLNYLTHLRSGRLTPRAISVEFDTTPEPVDVIGLAHEVAQATDPMTFLAALAPANPYYLGLRSALAALRPVVQAGGWPVLPEGPKLQPGQKGPGVLALRRRLIASGDLDPRAASLPVYDDGLRKAVAHFQARHGLEADGAVGATTRAALNVPAERRLAQMVANLERARWIPADFGPRHVRVNIPSFQLQAVDGGVVRLEMPVIVGTAVRRTPILSSQITSLVLNPMWTVPRKLAREDLLPKLQKQPGYLEAQGIRVYSGWGSEARELRSRDLSAKTLAAMVDQVKFRQDPGPLNALGQIKFNIPNGFDVYLHDTSHREKFARTVRALSSGCVRVGDPMALAGFLTDPLPEWPPQRRQEILDSAKTTVIALRQPVPVHLLYQTVWRDAAGVIQIRDDVYGRDDQVREALERRSLLLAGKTATVAMR